VLDLAPAPPDPETAQWLRDLQGPGCVAAYERLHRLLLRVARGELRRRGPRVGIDGPELDDLAHQAAADALVAVRRKLGLFRGESRFTTWAYKFVVFEVSTKLGRHFWRTPRARLDAEDWSRLPDRFGLDPARENEWRELVGALRDAVDEVLSERQRAQPDPGRRVRRAGGHLAQRHLQDPLRRPPQAARPARGDGPPGCR